MMDDGHHTTAIAHFCAIDLDVIIDTTLFLQQAALTISSSLRRKMSRIHNVSYTDMGQFQMPTR